MTRMGTFSLFDMFIFHKVGIMTSKIAKSEDILKTA